MTQASTQLAQQQNNYAMGSRDSANDADNSQFLTFLLAGESYGVDILRVQEIKGWTPVTCIPNTPEYLKGVLNLRGTIVPILDMRLKFHLEPMEYTSETVIIVLSVKTDAGARVVGVVVDGVSDVMSVNTSEIKPSPDFGAHVNTDFINGLATVNDNMVMLLDIDKLCSTDELNALEQMDSSAVTE